MKVLDGTEPTRFEKDFLIVVDERKNKRSGIYFSGGDDPDLLLIAVDGATIRISTNVFRGFYVTVSDGLP